jgi:two-component system, LuxR family, sensor kinase FixL
MTMYDPKRTQRFEQLRKLAEDHLSSGTKLPASLPNDINELIHELEVHQIELEMQHNELQQAYDHLEKARQQSAELFDFAPVGYLITDRDGVILNANLTAAAMLGIERTELMQTRFANFLEKEDRDTYYIHRRAAFRNRQSQSCEVQIIRRNQSGFYAQINIDVVAQDEDVCRMSITNISQLKHAEEVLKQTLFREKELNELKTRLIDIISHEFRTPLSVILSSVEMLERYGDNNERMAKRFHTIRNTVWHLNDIVNDVLLAYHTGDETLRLRPEMFDIVIFTEQLIGDLRAYNNEDRIQLICNREAGEAFVTLDKHLLRRTIVNLVLNALKYSSEVVEFRLHVDSSTVTFHITDHGKGIAEEDQPYIYTLFYRGTDAENIPGTGIGLAIAKRAVEAQGGVISFTTRLNHGTTFVVRLPKNLPVTNVKESGSPPRP